MGSSRNSTRGECSRPRAISRRRFIPPEKVPTRLARRSHKPTISITCCRRSRHGGARHPVELGVQAQVLLGGQVAVERRVLEHQTDVAPDLVAFAHDIVSGHERDCRPLGRTSVQSMLIVVDLPAPLGPRKPNVSPAATAKSMPRTASISP